tara:strand:- start:93 stop:329 length:237 start_codon:yes stop_codon:yes gene_type:complete
MVKGYVEDRNKHDFISFMFQEANLEIRRINANMSYSERRKNALKEWRTLYSYYKNNYRFLNSEWNKQKSQWLSRGEIS